MGRACCVPGCKSGLKVPSHKFPKCPQRCLEWIQSLKLDHLRNYCADQLQKYKVCHKHFIEEHYSLSLHRRFLLSTAIPIPFVTDHNIETSNTQYSSQQQFENEIDVQHSQITIDIHNIETSNTQYSLQQLFENEIDVQHSQITVDNIETSNTQYPSQQQFENEIDVQHSQITVDNIETSNTQCSSQQQFENEINMQHSQIVVNNQNISENNMQQQVQIHEKQIQNHEQRMQNLEAEIINVKKMFKRRPQLQEITRTRALSPIAKRLYNINIKLKQKNRYLKRLIKHRKIEKEKKRTVQHNIANTSSCSVEERFLNMMLRNKDVPSQARRYSVADKIFCIGIYKRSRAAYLFLSKYLLCPSITTLNSQLSNIPLQPGCTKLMIKYLKHVATDIHDKTEKFVVLIWDEISLQPALSYDKRYDKIIGFEDWGNRRTRKIADHAITFYLRCLKTGTKMPLGYGFCESSTKSVQLVRCVKQWLINIINCDLIPVATVCDQGATNVAALNTLISDSNNNIQKKRNLCTNNSFLIKGCEVFPLFDYVHLEKALRNNWLTKDLCVDINKKSAEKKYGSWDDIVTTYNIDKYSLLKQRQMPKLTDKHIIPHLIPKMRVKYATEVLSKTVSNFMDIILYLSKGVVQTQQGPLILPRSAETTSKIILFFNDLFDSFNGKIGQGLSSILSSDSGHFSFWKDASEQLRNMHYVEKKTRQIPKRNNTKCIKNWLWTIKGVQEIWKILQKAQFKSLNLKFLNQDVLENFFGQIRSFGGSNRNPNPKQFHEAFKALLMCNLTSKQSFGTNCKEDSEGTSLALSELIDLNEEIKKTKLLEEMEETDFTEAAIPQVTTTEIMLDPKKIIQAVSNDKIITKCQECTHNLNNAQLAQFIQHAVEKVERKFSDICYEVKIAEKVRKMLEDECLLPCLSQCTHLKTVLFTIIANEFIKAWCAFVNKILCRKIDINSDNHIYNSAKHMSKKYMKKISENKEEK